jgi:hypothetical protein
MTLASGILRSGQMTADAFDPCAESLVTRRFVESLVPSSPPFDPRIHVADDMYRYNLSSLKGSRPCAAILYYQIGRQILQTLQHVAKWRFEGLEQVSSLLDFASGHGRVTRFLARELAPGRIRVSEIHLDAVSFQHERFGVEAILSTSEPDAFTSDRRFPVVVASSFFSHLPADPFRAWMAALLRCVDRDGLLVFSTLGSELLGHEGHDWSEGIVFVRESETDRLEKSSYGTAYVTEGFVRDAIACGSGDPWRVKRFPEGFCGLQDLYVLSGTAGPDLSLLEPISFARGDADVYEVSEDGTLRIEGWLRIREDMPQIRRVEFSVNQELLQECDPKPVSRGVFRWSFAVDSRQIATDDVLMIRAITSKGLSSIVALGTPRTHPPARKK